MTSSSIAALAACLSLSSVAFGCSPSHACPPALTAIAAPAPAASAGASAPSRAPPARHVYRLDFVLAASEAGREASKTEFSLTLEEQQKGHVHIGRNVLLGPPGAPSPATAGSPAAASQAAGPRQDVGVKVTAEYRSSGSGDDLLLEVTAEMSAVDPPASIRKVVTHGNALASAGKSALVTMLDDEHKRYQLTVTPAKLR